MMNVESSKGKRVWHSGPPPFVGWWNASANRAPGLWRWWSGTTWSASVTHDDSLESVQQSSETLLAEPVRYIEWTDYWPKNAVCPRLDPNVQTAYFWGGRTWAWINGDLISVPTAEEPENQEIRQGVNAILTEVIQMEKALQRATEAIARIQGALS